MSEEPSWYEKPFTAVKEEVVAMWDSLPESEKKKLKVASLVAGPAGAVLWGIRYLFVGEQSDE